MVDLAVIPAHELDRSIDPDIAAHLSRCRHCRKRLAAERRAPSGLEPTELTSQTSPPLSGSMARARASSELSQGTSVGEYEIIDKLAAGGMGAVYSAVHPVIGKKAAIKIIAPHLCEREDAVARFLQEARAVNAIGHRNIVDVFSFGSLTDGRSFLVMELLEGETLGERMEDGRLGLALGLDILDQVLAAVEAAHAKQIIHRDLKPDNVFLVPRRDGGVSVKLLDFGIAKLQDPGAGTGVRTTTTGMLLGTPLYMAPEQARGKAIDNAADVYALGAVGFEILVGRPPFWADNAAEVIAMKLNGTPPSASLYCAEVPPAIDHLLARMLSHDPAQRPTVSEVRAALRHPYAHVPAPARVMTTIPPSPRRGGRSLALAIAAAVAGLALAALALAIWLPSDRSPAPPGTEQVAAAPIEAAKPAPRPSQPAVAPLAAGGSLTVVAEPEHAEVLVDGRVLSSPVTPLRFVDDGVHSVEVRADGFESQRTEVTVSGGAMVQVPIALVEKRRSKRANRSRSGVGVAARPDTGSAAEPTATPPPRPPVEDKDAPIPDPFGQ